MITRDLFEHLQLSDKIHTVFEYGEELDRREQNEHRIRLYLVEGFFVESWYNTNNFQIVNMVTLSPDEVMEIYYDHIDISDIY